MARLITIGDSISQGFMSAAAARTDLCYSTWLARALGVPDHTYHYPHWEAGGMPVNLELILRTLQKHYGYDIFGPIEWTLAASRVANILDRTEDYYERGQGHYRRPYTDASGQSISSFHNLSAFSFTVSDAWQVKPSICLERLEPSGQPRAEDNTFGTPSDAFYRNAFRILNPAAGIPDHSGDSDNVYNRSQLDWVEHFAQSEAEGIENLIVWLGANNALGTVLDLKIKDSAAFTGDWTKLDHFGRSGFNLWTKEHFRLDYSSLLDRIATTLTAPDHARKQPQWRVFLSTVPAVTVAPIARGIGDTVTREDPFGIVRSGAAYYERYSFFIFGSRGGPRSLTLAEAYAIDQRIAEFNEVIRQLVQDKNRELGGQRFFIVDINAALLRAALKRNHGRPTYEFPAALTALISRRPDTRYYNVESGQVAEGGMFSLDGVHPTAIGHGVIAHEFLSVMKQAGVASERELEWGKIVLSDGLWTRPLGVIRELEQNEKLIRLVGWAMSLLRS